MDSDLASNILMTKTILCVMRLTQNQHESIKSTVWSSYSKNNILRYLLFIIYGESQSNDDAKLKKGIFYSSDLNI